MSTLATAPDSAPLTLQTGDTHAESGDWSGALQSWSTAVTEDSSLQPDVERRLVWFLKETGHRVDEQRITVGSLVLFSGAAAVAAISFVLVAGEPGSSTANVWAVAAWIMIAISMALAIVAAKGPSRDSYEALLTRARAVAARLDSNPDNGSSS